MKSISIEILNSLKSNLDFIKCLKDSKLNILNFFSSMEKQIPKKIVYQEYIFEGKTIRTNGIEGVTYDLCPGCMVNLCTSGNFSRPKNNYCQYCGQKLDWSK